MDSTPRQPPADPVELRLLREHETSLARRLAALDDADELVGQIMLARVGGEAVAAVSLSDQRVVADPFFPTSEAVALLRLRAAQLSPKGQRASSARTALTRLRASRPPTIGRNGRRRGLAPTPASRGRR